jgi:hypothetical protein
MRYTDLVQAPKLGVRAATAAAMIEIAKVFQKMLDRGWLKPVNPGDSVPLYDVEEIKTAWLRYRADCQGARA